jgi:hypothetical protein
MLIFQEKKDDTTFFEYYKEMGSSGDPNAISNFGVFVKAANSVNIENMFLMNKQKCITEIGNKWKGTGLRIKLNFHSVQT